MNVFSVSKRPARESILRYQMCIYIDVNIRYARCLYILIRNIVYWLLQYIGCYLILYIIIDNSILYLSFLFIDRLQFAGGHPHSCTQIKHGKKKTAERQP